MQSFSAVSRKALHQALLSLASERHQEYASLAHLLLALPRRAGRGRGHVRAATSTGIDMLRRNLVEYIDTELAQSGNWRKDEDSKPTAGFQRVIPTRGHSRAVVGPRGVTGANVLVALFAERESHAVYFLQEQNMSRLDAVNYMSHGIAKRPGMSDARPVRGVDDDAATVERSRDQQEEG